MVDATEPSAIVLPFGKHKGKTVAELLAIDPAYAEWISGQAWVAERFAQLHAAIVARGAGGDDSPEHNALQARFLEPEFREGLAWILIGDWETSVSEARDSIRFETRMASAKPKAAAKCQERLDQGVEPELRTGARYEVKGADIVLGWWWVLEGFATMADRRVVELKPTLGDDYPAVLRQMKRLEATVLVVGSYQGRGVSEPQVVSMFRLSDIEVVFVQEIEEVMSQRTPW